MHLRRTRARHISGYTEAMAAKSVLEWAAETGWSSRLALRVGLAARSRLHGAVCYSGAWHGIGGSCLYALGPGAEGRDSKQTHMENSP